MDINNFQIYVIGSGSWGTAAAKVICENYKHKKIYVHSLERNVTDDINIRHINHKYLPNINLPENMVAVSDLQGIYQNNTIIFIVIPSKNVENLSKSLYKFFNDENAYEIACLSKGLVYRKNTVLTMADIIEESLPRFKNKTAIISGPSFAKEVAERKHTFLAIGAKSEETLNLFSEALSNSYIHCIKTYDIKGVALGGALKNPIAIASGIASSMPASGYNLTGALIAQGMKEIDTISHVFKVKRETIYGVAGLGDLITTSVSSLSRNRTFGQEVMKNWKTSNSNFFEKLAEAIDPQSVLLKKLNSSGYLVEGGYALKPILQIAEKNNIKLPLFQSVYEILVNKKEPSLLVEVMQHPDEALQILTGTKSLNDEKPKEFGKFKGTVFYKIVSERTYNKLLNSDNFLEKFKQYIPEIIERLEQRKNKTKKSLKEKYDLDKYIELLKKINSTEDRAIVNETLKNLCDLYAQEIADDFSSKSYKVIKRMLLLVFKYVQNKYFKLEIAGDLNKIKKISKTSTIIYAAMHKSNLDGPMLGLAMAYSGLPPVRYATGTNLVTSFFKQLFFRKIGSYTVDREEKNNTVYLEVLKQYSTFLTENGIDSLVFPEGTRSRNGQINPLKYGLLKTSVDAYLSKDKKYDIVIVPVTISYEHVMEENLFSGITKSMNVLGYLKNIKNIHINFCEPINISNFVDKENAINLVGDIITDEWKKNVKLFPNQILCKVLASSNYEVQKINLRNKLEDLLQGTSYMGEIDNIIAEGLSALKSTELITEDQFVIKGINTKIIDYYANMVPISKIYINL